MQGLVVAPLHAGSSQEAAKRRGYGKHKIDSRDHATRTQHTGSQEPTQINATERGQPTRNTLTFVFVVFENINDIHHRIVVGFRLLRSPNVPVSIPALQDLKRFKRSRVEATAQPCTCQATAGERAFGGD